MTPNDICKSNIASSDIELSQNRQSYEATDVKEAVVPNTASEAFAILLHKVGDYGKYQVKLMIIAGFCGVFTSLHNMGAVFLAGSPEHWCLIPQLADHNNNNAKEIRNLTAPWVPGKDGTLRPSQCTYYDRNYSDITDGEQDLSLVTLDSSEGSEYSLHLDAPINETKVKYCNSWVYDTDVFLYTVVSEWNLVCDRKWMMSSIQASYMMGILTGAVVFSAVSDKIGRRKAVLICAVLFASASVVASFSVSLAMFLILRFVVAAAGQGMFLVNYIITMECVSLKGRNIMGNLYHIFFSVGFVFLPLLAYHFRDWRHLQLVCSVPTIILLGYYWVLPESPRWLLFHGKKEEGLKILGKIAAANSCKLPEEAELNSLLHVMSKEIPESSDSCREKVNSVLENVVTLVRTPNMRRRNLITFYVWFVVSMIYYGLTFSGANINAPLYATVALAGAMEFPALFIIIFLLLKFGRRPCTVASLLLSGLSCIAVAFVPLRMVWLNLLLTTFGKFTISIAFIMAFMLSAELVPTNVRNISIGMASMCARIGSGLAPYIVDLLGDIYYAIPSTIFGVLSILSGLLCLLLPETGDGSLPESVEEIESQPR